MAIRLPVHVLLQDSSVKDVTDKATSLFEGLGSTSGAIFTEALQTSMGRTGDVFSNISAAAESMGTGIETSALLGAAGIAGIGIAAVKLGDELYSVGQRFDTIFDNLAWRTGKTGDDLAALEDTVRRVGDTTASSFEHIGDVAGQLSQAFDLAGPGLDDLTHRIATLDERMGNTLNIREFGQLLRGFDVDAANAGQTLNDLMVASERSMIPVNELVSRLQAAGPAARELGLNMGETANLMLAFEKSGLDASNTTMALSRAAQVFAEHNIDLNTGLDDTITQMKAFIDANNEAAAITLAKDVFGSRAARNFVDAVKDGTLSVKTLHDGIGPVGDKLTELDNQTRDWSENWKMLTNNVTDLVSTIGGPLFDVINTVLGKFNDLVASMKEPLPQPPGAPGDSSAGALGDLLGAPATAPAPGQPGFIGPVDTGTMPPGGPLGVALPPGLIPSDRAPHTPQDVAGALADQPSGGSGPGPQVPYPAEYTAGPLPGETAQQYTARMNQIEADHRVAEAQAKLDAVKADNTHTEDELQKAENDLAAAQTKSQETRLRNATTAGKSGIDVAIPYAPGYGIPEPGETTQQYQARQAVIEAQHRSAEEQAKLNQMESSGVATQNDIINQKNKVLDAQRAQQAAEMRLNDVYTKQVTDATKGLDALGAGLDKDLGLSKGLAGLADNLVRFLGNLAAAPLLGQLNAISAAQGGPSVTGSGLIGMAGAMGAFGPQFQVGGYDQSGRPISLAQMQGGGAAPGLSTVPVGAPTMLQDTGRTPSGPQSRNAAALIEQQWGAQLRGKIGGSRDTGTAPGTHDAGLAIDIPIGPDQKGLGDQINAWLQSNAGQLGLKYSIWRDRGQYPGGGGFNQPGHQDHIDAQFDPNFTPTGAAAMGPARNFAGGSIPIPLPVTIVGGSLAPEATLASATRPAGGGGLQGWLSTQLQARGLSPDEARGILAMNQVEGGATDPRSLLGFTESQAKGPGGHVDAFMRQWNDPTRRGPGGAIPGVIGGRVTDWPAYMTWIRERIVGQTGVQSDWQGNAQPPAQVYQQRLMDALGPVNNLAPTLYDAGGILPPGPTLAVNNTGMPEQVVAPNVGSAASNIPGSTPSPVPGPANTVGQDVTRIGGGEQRVPKGGSAAAGGGLAGAATGAAAMAADMFAPGSGAAVQIASQEIQRAIKFGSQAAGIGVSGLMETFLPAGGSELANNNWLTRIGGAVSGAGAALPNLAGKAPNPSQTVPAAAPPMPGPGQHTGSGAPPGPQTGVHIENYNVVNSEDRAGQDLARFQMAATAPQGQW